MAMQKKRPCIVYEYENSMNTPVNRIVSAECIFHRWITKGTEPKSISSKEQIIETYGLVEMENGLIILVEPNKIKFTDK